MIVKKTALIIINITAMTLMLQGGFIERKNPTPCPNVNVNSHLYKIVEHYYPEIANAEKNQPIQRFNVSSKNRTLEDYRQNIRQFGLDIADKRDKERSDCCLNEYEYHDRDAHPLVWTLWIEDDEVLRSYIGQDAALRDVAVAIGLTRPYEHYRRFAVEFADQSELNYPVLALRVPYEPAKKYLSPYPEHQRLLDHLTIINAEYKDIPKLVDEYIAKYPDYTDDDVKTTSIALNSHSELLGMKGAALLYNGDKFGALRLLMKHSDKQDISIIAEQILSLDELKQFVDTEVAMPDGKEYGTSAYEFPLQPNEAESFIRNLLARRLMRVGREMEAKNYFNGQCTKAIVDCFFAYKVIFDDTSVNSDSRTMAAMELGMQMRRNGDLLRGTSLEPDHTVIKGDSRYHIELEALPFEINIPDLPRFHYRYIAAEYFRKAAELTSNIELKSNALWMAGAMLKYRDPEKVEADFKKLTKLPTRLGKDADKRNWFTPISEVRYKFADERFYHWWNLNDPNVDPAWSREADYVPFEQLPSNENANHSDRLLKELRHNEGRLTKTVELMVR